MFFVILLKWNLWEKSCSSVMALNAFNQSGCRILWSLISLEEISWYIRFLQGDSRHGKITSNTNTFGWMWPVVSLVQSDCKVLWFSIFLEGINRYLRFFCFEIITRERQHLKLKLLFGCGQLCHFSNEVARFFDHQCLCKEWSRS